MSAPIRRLPKPAGVEAAVLFIGLMLCAGGRPGAVLAQTPSERATADRDETTAAPDAAGTRDGRPVPAARRRVVTAALYLLAGIAVCGIILIVLVMLWGVRVRRVVRSRSPATPPPDPLWYLKSRSQAEAAPLRPGEGEDDSD